MSPVDFAIVRRKLESIALKLRQLEPIAKLDEQAYQREDIWHRKGTERLLHEVIEAAVDINTHLLVQSGRPTPDSMFESFIELGKAGILTGTLANTLAPSAGLRNRLVHEYETINEAWVHRAVRDALRDYPLYMAAVEDFLNAAQNR